MRVKFVTAFAVIFVGLTSAEWIDFGTGVSEAKIEILEQNSTHTKLEVTVPGIEVQQEAVGGRVFTRLSVPGSGAMPDSIGRPEIPRVPVLLAVPCGAQVTVTLVERRVRIVEAKDVYPLQPPLPDGFSNPDFVVDQDFYSRSGPYPQSPVHASDVQVWRDLKLVPVSISLVCVKPAEGTLEVASKLTLNVSYEGGKWTAPSIVDTQLGVGFQLLLVLGRAEIA